MSKKHNFTERRLYTGLLFVSPFLLLIPFWTTWVSLHNRWNETNGTYSHGYVLVLIVVYLFYSNIKQWSTSSRSVASVLPYFLAAGALLVWVVGFATQTQLFEQLAMPVILWCWAYAVFGWRNASKIIPPFLLMYCAIPFWDFLLPPLRLGTMNFVQFVVELLALPVLFDGFQIMMPIGTLVVAGGCAGLNYFMVAVVIGAVNGLVMFDSWKTRTLTIIAIAAIAIVANWVRVLLLVLIAYYSEMQSSLVRDHGMFGWVVFGLFLVPYFYWISRLPQIEQKTSDIYSAVGSLNLWPYLRVSLVFIVVVSLIPVWLVQEKVGNTEAYQSPLEGVSEMGFTETFNRHWKPDFQAYDYTESLEANVDGERYELVSVSYIEQHQGKELIYYQNKLADETRLTRLTPVENGSIQLNRAVVKVAYGWRKVWWLYRVGGTLSVSPLKAKLLQIPAIVQGNTQASFVALSVRCRSYGCESERQDTPEQQKVIEQWLLAMNTVKTN